MRSDCILKPPVQGVRTSSGVPGSFIDSDHLQFAQADSGQGPLVRELPHAITSRVTFGQLHQIVNVLENMFPLGQGNRSHLMSYKHEWFHVVVDHYRDEGLEEIRRRLVRLTIGQGSAR